MKFNKIYKGDCIKLMEKLENESIDLIIADPPYNLNKDFGNKSDKWLKVQDWVDWSKQWITIAVKKLKPTGSIFVYGIHNYQCYIQVFLYELGFEYRRQIIWYYENGFTNFKKAPAAHYEPLLWFSKTKNYTYHTIREPYKSQERLKNKITKNGKIWQPHPDGKQAGDVWNIPVLAGKRFEKEKENHPTQKPLQICDRIIKHFSNQGEKILIPFCGSGSECVSAALNGREFISFEINEEYINIANDRLKHLDLENSSILLPDKTQYQKKGQTVLFQE